MFFSPGAEAAFTQHALVAIILRNHSGKGSWEPRWDWGLYAVFMGISHSTGLIAFGGAQCVQGGVPLPACAADWSQPMSALKITPPRGELPSFSLMVLGNDEFPPSSILWRLKTKCWLLSP